MKKTICSFALIIVLILFSLVTQPLYTKTNTEQHEDIFITECASPLTETVQVQSVDYKPVVNRKLVPFKKDYVFIKKSTMQDFKNIARFLKFRKQSPRMNTSEDGDANTCSIYC